VRGPSVPLSLLVLSLSLASGAGFNGASALEFTRRAVALGPRIPGSAAHKKLQNWILSELRSRRCEVIQDSFTARTPAGVVRMTNIVARFPGTSASVVAVTGHYDTKALSGIRFVGANDGGSSTGFLLEMARVLQTRPLTHDVYLVWFDGEEAVGPWSETDGLYGSRHLAARWAADGTLRRIKALINVDMIGDRDLEILRVENASATLTRLIRQAAADTGYSRYFPESPAHIEDDHVPFHRMGVNVANLIDFDYGPGNSFWHTDHDTMDKLSGHSFEVVGDVVMETLRRLEK